VWGLGFFAVSYTQVWLLINIGIKIEAENSFVLFHFCELEQPNFEDCHLRLRKTSFLCTF